MTSIKAENRELDALDINQPKESPPRARRPAARGYYLALTFGTLLSSQGADAQQLDPLGLRHWLDVQLYAGFQMFPTRGFWPGDPPGPRGAERTLHDPEPPLHGGSGAGPARSVMEVNAPLGRCLPCGRATRATGPPRRSSRSDSEVNAACGGAFPRASRPMSPAPPRSSCRPFGPDMESQRRPAVAPSRVACDLSHRRSFGSPAGPVRSDGEHNAGPPQGLPAFRAIGVTGVCSAIRPQATPRGRNWTLTRGPTGLAVLGMQ